MTRLRPETRLLPLAFALLALAAQAQQGEGGAGAGAGAGPGPGPGRGAVQPRLSVSQSWTDNLRLAERDKDAALITTVSPGVTISRNTGMVQGSLDYSLYGITYLKTEASSRVQNSLSANLRADLVPETFSVDARATIGQQTQSAFGLQSAPTLGSQGNVSLLDNPNSRETGTLTVSPALRTRFGGVAVMDLRGNATVTDVRGTALGDSRATGATLQLSQPQPGLLSWYAQAATQQSRAKLGQTNRNTSVTVGLNYRPDPDLRLSANVGQERSDYLSQSGTGADGSTWGVTADWTPTPRTRANAAFQRHTYGDSRNVSFEHRMRSSVWRYADTRNVTLGNTGATGGQRTNYDLYFLLLASAEPDPVKRDILVRTTLQALGLSPDALAATGFLSTGPSQTRNQSLSLALQGVRASITALVGRTVTSRLAAGLNQGDLANNARIEQRSYSLTGSYQLSPVSALALSATRQEAQGDAAAARTQLTSWFANWNARLGARLSVQLGARHSRSEGSAEYTENSVYGSLTQQF